MKILIDTNVLLDYILLREPFAQSAQKIIDYCRQELLEGSIAAQSVADMFYILRKNIAIDERRRILKTVGRFELCMPELLVRRRKALTA